jgi:hypothetical protein
MDQLPVFNRLISQPNGVTRNYAGIMEALSAFNERLSGPALPLHGGGEDSDSAPAPSPPPQTQTQTQTDELKPLLTVLGGQSGSSTGPGGASALPVDMELAVARALKILLRKPVNRENIGKFGVKCMVEALTRQAQRVTAATAEIGNATLNACYNGANVVPFLEQGGMPPLLQLLRSRDTAVQGSALGALQSLCFVPWGRRALLDDDSAILCIARLLLSDDELVRARAVGVMHNVSAEVTSLALLRESMCISPVVSLLADPSAETCQAAVGALQNMSREEASRQFMLEQGVVPKLVNILFCDNMQSQVRDD